MTQQLLSALHASLMLLPTTGERVNATCILQVMIAQYSSAPVTVNVSGVTVRLRRTVTTALHMLPRTCLERVFVMLHMWVRTVVTNHLSEVSVMSSASVDALGQQPSTVSHVFHMPRKAAMEDAFVMRIGRVTSVNETYQALPTVIQNVAVAQGQPTTNVSHE